MAIEGKVAVRAAVIALAMLVAVTGSTSDAVAGKKRKKRIREEKQVTAYPYPLTGAIQEGGCLNGVEGINKLTVPFETPWSGVLVVELFDFEFDWDLHLTSSDGSPIDASANSQPTDPGVEELTLELAKGEEVQMVACNWLGGSEATLRYTYTHR